MKIRLIPPLPIFTDENKNLQAHLTLVILKAFFLITPFCAVACLFIYKDVFPQLWVGWSVLVVLAFLGTLFFLLTRGFLVLTNWLVLIFFWFLNTLFMFFSGGSYSQALYGYFPVVVLAGLLFESRVSAGVTALCILSSVGIFYTMENILNPSAPALIISSSIYLIILAVLQNLATSTMRRALHHARISESQFRLLFEESPDGICITDAQNRIMMTNMALTQLLGYSSEEFHGKDPASYIAPENLSSRPPRSYNMLRESGIVRSERILMHQDSRRIPVLISGREIPDKRYQYIIQDITQLKQAEKELQQQRDFAFQIMENIGQGLTVTGLEGLEYVNPAFTQMTGYGLDEVKGKFPFEFTLPEDHSVLFAARAQRQEGKSSRYEVRICNKAGDILHVLVVAVPRWEDERVVGSIAILTDLTEQKKMEQALRHSEETAREFLEKLKIVHELNIELSKATSLDDLYRKTVELGRTRLEFDRISLFLYEKNASIGTYGTDPSGNTQTEHDLYLKLEDTPQFKLLIETGAWGQVKDNVPLFHNLQQVSLGWNAIVVLWDQNQPLGFLAIDNLIHQKPYPPDGDELLKLFSLSVSNLLVRKRAEAALSESEALYRQSIEAADAVPYQVMYGPHAYEKPYTFMGSGINRLTGYTSQEMTPKVWDSLIVESRLRGKATGLTMREALQRARDGELTIWQCDYRIQTRHGGMRWVADTAVEILNEQGTSKGAIGILQDITDRNNVQEALEREHYLLRTIIDNLPDYIYLKDTDHRCMVSNIANAQTLGITPEEMVGKTLADFYPAEEAERYNAKDRQIIETGKGIINEENTFINTLTNAQHWTLMSRIPFRDANGEVIGVIGISHDITARKQAEIALAEQAEETAMLYQVSGKLVLTASNLEELSQRIADIVVNELNLAECSVWLLREDREVLSRIAYRGSKQVVVRVEVPLNGLGLMTTAIRTGKIIYAPDVREDNRYFPGAFKTLSELVIPLRVQDRIIGVFNIESQELDAIPPRQQRIVSAFAERAALALENTRLVESLEKAVTEVQRLNLVLENRVAERTADLEKRTRELEEANAELEAFSYSVSHDLRAPLRAINGYSTILKEEYLDQLPSNAQQLLERMSDGANRMAQLVNDLLAFSRISRKELNKRLIYPINLVHEALNEHQSERLGREIEITIGELPPCEADPALLRQVYANLISNALKFTHTTEEASIEISAKQENGETIYFVRDNGAGFDMRYADKLFAVFQRLHTADQFEGTGIGLANVKRIITRHGGRVWAEAEVNKGATFYFTLK